LRLFQCKLSLAVLLNFKQKRSSATAEQERVNCAFCGSQLNKQWRSEGAEEADPPGGNQEGAERMEAIKGHQTYHEFTTFGGGKITVCPGADNPGRYTTASKS